MTDKNHDSFADDILKDLENFDMDHSDDVVNDGPDITVTISEDKMKASVKVKPPIDSANITHDAVLQELKNNKVVHGIDERAVDDIFSYGTYNVDVVVAKGTQPSQGTPSSIEYKFETNADKKVDLQEDEHGNVDHKQMHMINSVEEGTLLAVKIASIAGEEGKTVTGEVIPVVKGQDFPLPLGENVKATEDGLGIVAAISGQPGLRDGKVLVSAVYEIKGDVGYSTGNVDFEGSVMITGNVSSDFVVKAKGNVDVQGNIDKALIEAGGDVRVRGGMYGGGSGHIKAGGSVWIRSVDSGIIEAHENIIIGQQSRMSTLTAEADIILTNSKGSIVGGKATAAHEFNVTNLGSPSFTDTVVEIGINPRLKKVHDTLDEQIKGYRDQLEKVTTHIKTVRANEQQRGSMTDKEKEVMQKLVPTYHKLKAALEKGTAKLKYLDERIAQLGRGKARVRGTVYPGVKLYTVNTHMPIRKEIKFSSFYEQNEQIIVGPY